MGSDFETIEIFDNDGEPEVENTNDSPDNPKKTKASHKKIKKRKDSKPEKEHTGFNFNFKKIKIRYYIIAAVLLFIAVFLIVNNRHLAPMKFSEWISDGFARVGSGAGYPYSINCNSVRDIDTFGSDTVILTDSSLIVLNPSAKEVANRSLSLSNPAMQIASDRMIVYDVGGNKFSVQNRSSVLFSGETEYAISVCEIGDNGNFAVATKDEVYAGVVKFYSYAFKEEFTWNSGNSYIVDIALSPNGKYGAVTTLNANQGEMYSTIYIFNFKTMNTVSYKFENSIYINVSFKDNDSLVAVCDGEVTVIKGLQEDGKVDTMFELQGTLFHVFTGKDGYAVVSSLYDNNDIYEVKYINKSNKEFTKEINGAIYDVCASSSLCAVLSDNKVYVLLNNHDDVKEISLTQAGINSDARKIIVCNSNIYIMTSDSLLKLEY